MLFGDCPVLVRGGGDLGTGVVLRLHRAGFPVIVTELDHPLAVRRRVAVATAVLDGMVTIEGMQAQLAASPADARALALEGVIAVLVDDGIPEVGACVVVDARLAKRALDTSIVDADLVVALGPGFTVGVHCHAVIETARGPRLGRVLYAGTALADTGVPDPVEGRSNERVLRSPSSGSVHWRAGIGDEVAAGQVLGNVDGEPVVAPFRGVVRGLISPDTAVIEGLKIGDVDPRLDTPVDEVSDKALAIGGGVVEAVLSWISART